MFRTWLLQRSRRMLRSGVKRNGKVDPEKSPRISWDPEIKQQVVWTSDKENNIPTLRRSDSLLISAFETDHIRQIQTFLLFPVLNPLSDKPTPAPQIVQVWLQKII